MLTPLAEVLIAASRILATGLRKTTLLLEYRGAAQWMFITLSRLIPYPWNVIYIIHTNTPRDPLLRERSKKTGSRRVLFSETRLHRRTTYVSTCQMTVSKAMNNESWSYMEQDLYKPLRFSLPGDPLLLLLMR